MATLLRFLGVCRPHKTKIPTPKPQFNSHVYLNVGRSRDTELLRFSVFIGYICQRCSTALFQFALFLKARSRRGRDLSQSSSHCSRHSHTVSHGTTDYSILSIHHSYLKDEHQPENQQQNTVRNMDNNLSNEKSRTTLAVEAHEKPISRNSDSVVMIVYARENCVKFKTIG